MKSANRLKDPQGFLKISFVCSDGTQGERLVESHDAEATFNYLCRTINFLRPPADTNQLELSLAQQRATAHTFR